MDELGTLKHLVAQMSRLSDEVQGNDERLWQAIQSAIDPSKMVSILAEVLRIPAAKTEQLLIENGFGEIVAKARLSRGRESRSGGPQIEYRIASREAISPFPDLFSIEFTPPLQDPIALKPVDQESVSLLVGELMKKANQDTFLALYRKDVLSYYEEFMASDAILIDQYIAKRFGGAYPKYIVNSGIGANEQFNHFVAHLNNSNSDRICDWLVISSPRHLVRLPSDANVENTLFMEFSRSGKTEETVKIHEYTPRDARRIVFANSGPLRDIGLRDDNLVLRLPDEVAGRFGRNKTPILLAPMHIARMDTWGFWQTIGQAIARSDLSVSDNLPMQVAEFIYLYQQQNGINHIYFGCNDDVLAFSVDEMLQFWNEGVNKDGNDISMSRYFGLLRDSHANIEGLLANHRTKLGIFLLRDSVRPRQLPPMTIERIDPIDKNHVGLCFGDEEKILAEANYQRFSEVMPTIKMIVHGDLTLNHAAVLGQFWSDTTFCYSKLRNVDPGSNPEVKSVRDRAATLLSEGPKRCTD